MIVMLKGSNGREVVSRVEERLEELQPLLPKGVTIRPFYNQGEVVDRTTHTVFRNLLEGGLLVVADSVSVPSQRPRIADHGLGDPALAALRVLRHAALRRVGQPHEPRRPRLRADRGRVGRHGRELRAASRPSQDATPSTSGCISSARPPSRSARPILFGVFIIIAVYLPIFSPRGPRGPDVRAHGVHGVRGRARVAAARAGLRSRRFVTAPARASRRSRVAGSRRVQSAYVRAPGLCAFATGSWSSVARSC